METWERPVENPTGHFPGCKPASHASDGFNLTPSLPLSTSLYLSLPQLSALSSLSLFYSGSPPGLQSPCHSLVRLSSLLWVCWLCCVPATLLARRKPLRIPTCSHRKLAFATSSTITVVNSSSTPILSQLHCLLPYRTQVLFRCVALTGTYYSRVFPCACVSLHGMLYSP